MSGRKQFWLGSVMLAAAMGILVGTVVMPQTATAQTGEGRTQRYALVRGVSGTTQRSETIYVVDDLNQMLFAYEYQSRSRKVEFRQFVDLQAAGAAILKKRATREKR
ncbi:hypothetical protein HQ560_04725 [bacterium]|nr:hypothetical protein [bacterium]